MFFKRKASTHNKTLRRVAGGYKSQDWKVKAAHIPGYSRPKAICGKIPDLIAQKGNRTRIVEVETPHSYNSDNSQRNIFRRFASKSKDIRFRTKLTRG